MDSAVIQSIIQEFGPVTWTSFGEEGVFLLKVTPLPPPDELEWVIADICAGEMPVRVNQGRVYHSSHCTCQNHDIQDERVRNVIHKLKEETFVLAVHPNISGPNILGELPYEGKPLVIPFNPIISYMNFPDHPHLSMGTNQMFLQGTPFYIPDTICFTAASNDTLGNNQVSRLLNTFDEITIWLLRHQVWVATRETTGHGIWIGPHEGHLDPEAFVARLNPEGNCRCGNRKQYSSCHLKQDLEEVKIKYGLRAYQNATRLTKLPSWIGNVLAPQKELYHALHELTQLA